MEIITLASRPDLADALFAFPGAWPPFMYEDPTSDLYYEDAVTAYPEFVMLAVEGDQVVARLFSVPLRWDGDPATGVPEGGWDWVIRRVHAQRTAGTRANLVSALEIHDPGRAPWNRSGRPHARRDAAERGPGSASPIWSRRCGRTASPRTRTSRWTPTPGALVTMACPRTPGCGCMYVRRSDRQRRPPVDDDCRDVGAVACLERATVRRVRSGARAGRALVPVVCEPAHDFAVYVEPNVWVHHRLPKPASR